MEHSGTTEVPPREDVAQAARPAPADGARPATSPERPDGGPPGSRSGRRRGPWRRDQDTSPPPWRVEGMPPSDKAPAGGRPNWSRFWLVLLGLLILNWILGSLLTGAVRPTVPYTFFLNQVNANNVQTVTSTGDTIQGTFRHQVAYPAGTRGAAVHHPAPLLRQRQPVRQAAGQRRHGERQRAEPGHPAVGGTAAVVRS